MIQSVNLIFLSISQLEIDFVIFRAMFFMTSESAFHFIMLKTSTSLAVEFTKSESEEILMSQG